MKKIFLLIGFFTVSFIVLTSVFACIDFSVGFSTEVLLTKPGVQYDISGLPDAIDVKHKKIHFNSVEGLAYTSHYNDKVVVIIAEDALNEPMFDEFGDQESQSQIIKGLDVMIQIPYEFKENHLGVRSAVDINQDKFDFAAAMLTELNWLRDRGIIRSLSDADVKKIVSLCTQYTSGVGGRVIYLDDQWMLSEKAQGLEGIVNIPKSIPRGGSCSGGPDPETLMELVQ